LPVDVDRPGFIPVAQTLALDQRPVTLIVALNPDYFINHIMQQLDSEEVSVDVLRYDGTVLISTDSARIPGAVYDYVTRNLRLSELEFGQYEEISGANQALLTAFRASRLYPLVVVTQLKRDYALRHWQAEANTLFSIVVTVLLAIALLSFAFYRRQMLLTAQRMESLRLQRINATVFDSSAVAILITDLSANIISINPAYTRVTGYQADELIGHHLYELLTVEGTITFTEAMLKEQVAGLDDAAQAVSVEVQQRCKDGRLIWTEIHSTPEHDAAGAIVGYHRICRNVTERKRMEDQVRELAFYDPLTKLPNRRLLEDRLGQAMAASKRSQCYAALMFLDLDNFKPLNDQHGHAVGDLLLVEVANRLKSCVRETDTVARFGGDEFVVVLSVLSTDKDESRSQAASIADKILSSISMPYRLISRPDDVESVVVEHRCSTCIGVVVFVDYQISPDEILMCADVAMYEAKEAGRNTVRFYESAMISSVAEREAAGG
jgi:diguanylate cyclase (GGDEF)-like protein/PAS domain S-box-containing protein